MRIPPKGTTFLFWLNDKLDRRPAAEPQPEPEEVIFEAPTGGPCMICAERWAYYEDRICEHCYRQAELRWQEEDQL